MSAIRNIWLGSFTLVATALLWGLFAPAQAQDAAKVLKAMTDYVASQKDISATYDTDIEVITNDLQKIQFASSGQMLLSRPNKIRASRIGGYADVELVFDGKTLSILGKNLNAYAQTETAGSIDQLVAGLRNEFGMAIPGADLLLSGAYDELMKDVLDAKHIGRGVINGVECDHLAFRNNDVDWQLWVEVGTQPIPRKYIITNKAVTGMPQYTLRIKDWKTDLQVAADAFAFKPPTDAKKSRLCGPVGHRRSPTRRTNRGQDWRNNRSQAMTGTKVRLLRTTLAAIVGVGCLFLGEKASLMKPGSLVTEANAVIGRPLTPVSYAGVARRTTARAVVAAPVYAAPHVYAAPVYAAPVAAPACVQVVNAYGQLATVCR